MTQSHPTPPRVTAAPSSQPVCQPVCLPEETGAASAEYAAVTAAGVGLAGVLLKLFTSDFGQRLIEMIVKAFLAMVGIG